MMKRNSATDTQKHPHVLWVTYLTTRTQRIKRILLISSVACNHNTDKFMRNERKSYQREWDCKRSIIEFKPRKLIRFSCLMFVNRFPLSPYGALDLYGRRLWTSWVVIRDLLIIIEHLSCSYRGEKTRDPIATGIEIKCSHLIKSLANICT